MEQDVGQTMQSYAEDAVALAHKHFSIALDYSAASIEELERLAGTLCDTKPAHVGSEKLNEMAFLLGGYLGEVMRRELGGEWEIIDFNGSKTLALKMRDGSHVFPTRKILKRLTMGAEENVWHYFLFIRRDLDTL